MMKKIIKIIVAAVAVMAVFGFFAQAENDDADYAKSVESELFSSLDVEMKDTLENFGITALDEAAFDFSFESLTDYFTTNLKDKLNSAIKFLLEVLMFLMIAALAEMLKGKGEKDSVLSVLTVCILSLLVAKKTYVVLNIATMVVEAMQKLMVSFVPVYAGIIAVSGNPVSAATYNSVTLMLAQGVSLISSKLIVPLVGVILCLTVAFSMSRVVSCNRFLSAAGRLSNLTLGVAAAFFTGFLSFKNVLSMASDSAGTRGVRFLVSSLIPVVGSAMSDAYSAFASSINLIKGSVAVVGIVAVFISCFPAVVELLSYFAALSLLSFAAEMLGQNEASSLLKGFSLSVKILTLVLVYEMFIIVISTGLMLNVKGGA